MHAFFPSTTAVDHNVGWWCLCVSIVLDGCIEVGHDVVGWLDVVVRLAHFKVNEARIGV